MAQSGALAAVRLPTAQTPSVLSRKFAAPLRPEKALSVGGGAKAWWATSSDANTPMAPCRGARREGCCGSRAASRLLAVAPL